MELRLTPKHPTCAAATGIPGRTTTPHLPPTQAAKKLRIGPRPSLFHRRSHLWTVLVLNGGVKTGRRIPIWDHSTRTGAPFSLDSKNRSFSSREKETGFERSSLRTTLRTNHPTLIRRLTPPPSPWKGEGFIGRVWEAAPHSRGHPLSSHKI